MEELIERVSDIFRSPVICNIWQFMHRQKRLISLVTLLVLVFLSPLPLLGKDKVSRFAFTEYLYKQLFDRDIKPEEIRAIGIFDAFNDDDLHLDWPITRGIAAKAIYRKHTQQGATKKLPRAFADITQDSPFYQALNNIGGVFLARNKGRFEPDKLLTKVHLRHCVSVLKIKEIFDPQTKTPIITATTPITSNENFETQPVFPKLGFYTEPNRNFEYTNKALKKIENINNMSIATQQLNSQAISDIRSAVDAMDEVKVLLKKFGSSIFELTTIKTNIPGDDRAIRKALQQFDQMLKDVIIRFEYCKLQLAKATPISPELIQKCDILDLEIQEHTKQVKLLKKHIMDRLNQPPIIESYRIK